MFSRWIKADLAPRRWRAALPFFLLFYISFMALVLIFTTTLKHQISAGELRETERLMTLYLQEHSLASVQFAPIFPRERSQLGGLGFVRITRGNDRLLLATDDLPPSLYRELLHLEVGQDEAWRKPPGEELSVWTVLVRRLASGSEVVVGKRSEHSYANYQGIVRAANIALAAGFVVGWLAALLLVRMTHAPLRQACAELDALTDAGQGLLESAGRDEDARALYEKINSLIVRNRRLVDEMQISLDSVAHDLRTPMTRLRSVAEFGLKEDSDTGRLRDSLADCLEESERVLAMLRIMMSVAEAESGTMRLELTEVTLADSVNEMIELYEYVAEEKRITIEAVLEHEVLIHADRTRLSQVWANLIDNAIKYGRDGGRLCIESEAGFDNQVRVHFIDDGMGISDAEQGRIWERFYRGDRSRSEQGLGLGLNYVKAVVERHGGSVSVVSGLNRGSRFTVSLPYSAPQGSASSKEKSQTRGE